jgi:hypothetical protein
MVAGMCLSAMACGARTGLNTPQEGPRTGVWQTAAIQCGYCLTEPWCFQGVGVGGAMLSCRSGTPGCTEATCGAPAVWIGQAVTTYGVDGAVRELYCVQENGASAHLVAENVQRMTPPPPNTASTNWIDPCLLSDDLFGTWLGNPATSQLGALRANLCGIASADIDTTGSYRCDRIQSWAAPSAVYTGFAPMQCPKRAALGEQARFCVANTTAGLTFGRRLLATYAAAFSPVGSYDQPDITIPLRMCFARAGTPLPPGEFCNPSSAPAANLPIPHDPGIAPLGYLFQTGVNSRIEVAWNSQTATIPVTGMASAEIAEGAHGFHLTELRLTQTAPTTLSSGVSVVNGKVDLDNLWIGDVNAGAILVDPAMSQVQGEVTVGGAPQNLRLIAQTGPTGTWAGGVLDLDATYQDAENNISYHLILHLTQSQARPWTAITGVSEVEPECRRYASGFVGADVTVYGAMSVPVGQWSLTAGSSFARLQPAYTQASTPDIDPQVFDLPLLGPDDPPSGLMLSTFAGPLAAVATRADVRVVDRTPPSIVQTLLHVPCNWFATDNTKCIAVPGQFDDVCSATHGETVGGWAYNASSELIYTSDPKCFLAPPAAVLPDVVYYLLAYRARDAWHNVSATRWVLFTITRDPPVASGCLDDPHPVILWEG